VRHPIVLAVTAAVLALARLLCLILVLTAMGCADEDRKVDPAQRDTALWRLVYQHDEHGEPVQGRVEDLIAAMKRGSPIRVAWGGTEDDGTSWIEFAEPDFTTVMNHSAVVVQFPLSFIQTDYVDVEEALLKTDPPTGWRALMSTNGNYHQFHYDLRTGEVSRIMRARTQVSWFALVPLRDDRPIPDLTPRNTFHLESVSTP
jgi:hypothetical protein